MRSKWVGLTFLGVSVFYSSSRSVRDGDISVKMSAGFMISPAVQAEPDSDASSPEFRWNNTIIRVDDE
jgi:hypothetical protein